MDDAYSATSTIKRYFNSPILAQFSDRFEMRRSRSTNLDEGREQRVFNTGTKRDNVSNRHSFVHTGQMFNPSNGVRFSIPDSVLSSSSSSAESSPSPVCTPSTDLTQMSPTLSEFEALNLTTTPLAVRTIILMIEQHPELEAELNLLKKSILQYEGERHNIRSSVEAEKHKALYEAELKAEKLEVELKKKIDYIEAARAKLSEYEEVLDFAETSKQEVKELEEIVDLKEKEVQRLRRNKISSVLQSEREKSALTNMVTELEQRLETERIRAEDHMQAKDEAIRTCEILKNRMDTYLGYFERHGSQLRAYLFDEKKEVGFKDNDGNMDHGFGFRRLDAGKVVKLPSIIEEDENKEGAIKIKRATRIVRDRYEEGGRRVSGSDYLDLLKGESERDSGFEEGCVYTDNDESQEDLVQESDSSAGCAF